MARTVNTLLQMEVFEDSVRRDPLEFEESGVSLTEYSRQVLTLAAGASDTQVVFPTGLTSVTHCGIKAGSASAITYSRDGTGDHHRINASGFAAWKGDTTSLYLTNVSGADAVEVEILMAGD